MMGPWGRQKRNTDAHRLFFLQGCAGDSWGKKKTGEETCTRCSSSGARALCQKRYQHLRETTFCWLQTPPPSSSSGSRPSPLEHWGAGGPCALTPCPRARDPPLNRGHKQPCRRGAAACIALLAWPRPRLRALPGPSVSIVPAPACPLPQLFLLLAAGPWQGAEEGTAAPAALTLSQPWSHRAGGDGLPAPLLSAGDNHPPAPLLLPRWEHVQHPLSPVCPPR